MCGPYIKPSIFLFTEEDGESVTITFDESGSVGSSEIDEGKKIGQDYLDNLVYVMDVSNISDSGYHEMAQICNELPRACSVMNRRHELNKSCEVFNVENDFEGVYRSIEKHLIENLAKKPELLEGGKVQIKLSGDGTRAGTQKTLDQCELYYH